MIEAITVAGLTDLAVKATLVLLMAFGLVALMSRAGAASRHLVWVATFITLAILPVARIGLPIVPIRVLSPSEPEPDARLRPQSNADLQELRRSAGLAMAPVTSGFRDSHARTMAAAVLLFIGLAAGVGIALFRNLHAVVALRRLVRRTTVAEHPRLLARFASARARLQISRHVTLRVSAECAMPVTWGIAHPSLLLPASAAGWSDTRLDVVLFHELAHVRRLDMLTHAIGRVARALFWWHPLLGVALRRASLERERACDDLVLGQGVSASSYADALLSLLQSSTPGDTCSAGLSAARRSQVEDRVRSILATGINRRRASGRSLVLACALGLAGILSAATRLEAGIVRFDRVSVTRNQPGDLRFIYDPRAGISVASGGICPPWRPLPLSDNCFVMTNMTVPEMIQFAFGPSGLIPPKVMVFGGPSWLDTDRFDVVGRVHGRVALRTPPPAEQAGLVRSLLGKEFQLTLHHEVRELPIYALRLDERLNLESVLRPATDRCGAEVTRMLNAFARRPLDPATPTFDRSCITEVGGGFVRSRAITMAQLAHLLSNRLNQTVHDETGQVGLFQVDLTWNSGTLADALGQLGLVVETTTGSVDVLVVDGAISPVTH